MEIKIDEKQIADAIINELKRHNLLNEKPQNVTVVYNAEFHDIFIRSVKLLNWLNVIMPIFTA